jgi:hypothetical protein
MATDQEVIDGREAFDLVCLSPQLGEPADVVARVDDLHPHRTPRPDRRLTELAAPAPFDPQARGCQLGWVIGVLDIWADAGRVFSALRTISSERSAPSPTMA